nr:hypothetical protein GCM10020093_078320 [Planobispora longispora]
MLAGDVPPALLYGGRDRQQGSELGRDRRGRGSAHTSSTSAAPSGSWAAAKAECEEQQNRHWFNPDTYAAISSRSPRDSVLSPRSSTSASSFNGPAVSGR